MKKTLLVCGATGFIGRNVVEYFAQNPEYSVTGVYNRRPPFDYPGVSWIQADLTDPPQVSALLKKKFDVMVQAAATTSGVKEIFAKPHIHVTDNAVMNSFLFRAANDEKVGHVIFFSCTIMLQSSNVALREEDFDANIELHPRYFGAGWTKIYLEKMSEFYSRIGQTRFTVVRHSNVYGPYDKFDLERSHVFGATIAKVMNAQDGRISVWGNGEEARDLLYVRDLVSFVHKAIERQKSSFGIFNCGYGEPIRIKDLVKKIVAISGRPLNIEHDLSQPSINTSLYLNCEKAKNELGWERETLLGDGIAKTISWWRANCAEMKSSKA